jgi:hypothetical protein
MKRLENKVAVIYGNGAVGTTVANPSPEKEPRYIW